MAGNDSRLLAEVTKSLLEVQNRLRSMDADQAVKAEATRRFIAATNAAKRDPATAKRYLTALVDDLDSGRIHGQEPV
jgi:hypothetical protein